MRITMNLFIVFCYLIFGRLVSARLAVKFSKKEMKPAISINLLSLPATNLTAIRSGPEPKQKSFLNLDKAAYPQPLPTVPAKQVVPSPYKTLYQGLRYQDDVRVFRKRFDYAAKLKGQKIVCQGLFDCVISHISIESSEAIPVLLRGGAGYRHFTAVIKSKAHHDLKGQVRAYCRNKYKPLEDEEPLERRRPPSRRFFFGKRLAEEAWSS